MEIVRKKINRNNKEFTIIAARTIIVFSLLLLWQFTAMKGYYNPFYTSYPTEIVMDMVEFYTSGDLAHHASITLKEAFFGLFLGSFFGIILGVIFSQFKTFGKVIIPIISMIAGIPQLTLAPIYILWFGFGLISKVFLASLMVFFGVFFSTYNAIKNLDQRWIESSHLLGATSLSTLRHVVIPTSMPWIISGIRGGVSASMVGAIIGEYMGAAGGFGWMVSFAASYFNIKRVMSCILILLVVNMLMNWLLDKLEKYLLRWRKETQLTFNTSNI